MRNGDNEGARKHVVVLDVGGNGIQRHDTACHRLARRKRNPYSMSTKMRIKHMEVKKT